jgi:hypothetical protein
MQGISFASALGIEGERGMSRWQRTVPGGLLSLAILLGYTRAVPAESPTWWNRLFPPASACKRSDPGGDPKPVDPFGQRRITARQIGFEAQQQGYVAKVQGAASQNVIWVTPEEKPFEPSRKSWLASWQEFFGFSE